MPALRAKGADHALLTRALFPNGLTAVPYVCFSLDMTTERGSASM